MLVVVEVMVMVVVVIVLVIVAVVVEEGQKKDERSGHITYSTSIEISYSPN